MKKSTKILMLFLIHFFIAFSCFAKPNIKFGIGSGYVFYGDKDLKSKLDSFNRSAQMILCSDAVFFIPLAQNISLTFGADTIIDARWKGSNHIYLWDYCGTFGFRFYPGFAGLNADVQYCLGRRTDFFGLSDQDEYIHSSDFGNGFAFSLAYDFGWQKKGFDPEICASWRHMPRGGSSDNIIEVKFRF
ncbi:hypothetical protein [Treponema pectinovorum]|uniref:hypothetical protein n=1 Tax=Treponema pectinovorum TaxID=164 RepID=UPI003D919E70